MTKNLNLLIKLMELSLLNTILIKKMIYFKILAGFAKVGKNINFIGFQENLEM